MTNEEAINVLRWLNPPRANKKSFDDFNQATDIAIKALERQRWIPVTERLPNKFEDVWVTDNRGRTAVCHRGHSGWRDAESGDWMYCLDSIVAWMPYYVPEPYQERGEQ